MMRLLIPSKCNNINLKYKITNEILLRVYQNDKGSTGFNLNLKNL